MKKNYFVTSDSIVIADNLTKKQAIKKAKKTRANGWMGIGHYKFINGKKMYNLLPACFYF